MVRFWDLLRQLDHDYRNSERGLINQYKHLKSEVLTMADQMQSIYLNVSISLLVNEFNGDINNLYSIH